MDGVTLCFLVLASVLGLLALVLLVKYFRLRAELKGFQEQINEIRTTDREQPVKVASFSAPSVQLAQEINQLIAELRASAIHSAEEEQRVRTIMAGVSHDFRTPLTAADGYLQMAEELLAKEEMSPQDLQDLRDYLRIVSERIRYLRQLSDEFFEVTYLDAKKDIPLSEVRFDTVLSEVMLGQYERLQERQIDIRTDIPEEQLIVSADRHYLERILENLFSNAEKYARSFLEIRVERIREREASVSLLDNLGERQKVSLSGMDGAHVDRLRLIMRNDIDETLQIDPDHIFEPFYRAKGRSGPGTGLGLYVCKELAEVMHFHMQGEIRDGVFELALTMPVQK